MGSPAGELKKAVLLGGLLLGGCWSNDDGVDHAAVDRAQAPLAAAAKRSGGDWSKLSPDEQKLFLDRARGNEQSAKMLLGNFARAPSGPAR
jgi:hypothetical protein